MENASKALIIAGSILLAILIIAMGVMIFNNAKSAADTSTFDTAEINMFNQKFERYSNDQLRIPSKITHLICHIQCKHQQRRAIEIAKGYIYR